MLHARLSTAVFAIVLCCAGPARAQVELTPKPQPGSTVTAYTVRTNQVLNIGGMDVPTEAEARVRQTSTESAGAEGTRRLQVRTDSIAIKLSLPGGMSVDFDTEKPAEPSPIPQLQGLFDGWRALKGQSYPIVVDKTGKVKEVEGLDRVLGSLPPQSVDFFKGELAPERVKQDAAQEAAVFPGKPVKKGDTWSRRETTSIGSGQTLTFDVQYEYQGAVEKDGRMLEKVAILYTGVKYEVDPNGINGLKVVQNDLQVQASYGHFLFDRDRGLVVERHVNTRLAGPVTFEINGMQLGGKVDLTLDTNTSSKRQ